jgi:signal peptidase II
VVVLKYFGISFLVIAIDQISKFLTKTFMHVSQSEEVFGDFLRYTYIENPGMAFGIQIGNRTLFTIFSIVASLVIFIYLIRTKGDQKYVKLALSLILGGAIGNLIDRVLFGSVVDFIDMGIGDLRWPVFNVADMSVSIGMIILVFFILFEKKQPENVEEVRHADSSE